jgi:exopolysaccharide production protein ExoQ
MHLPPVVALWLTLGLIFFLFRREAKERSGVSQALWVPLIWLLINGSRSPSQWLNLSAGGQVGSMEDGNPLDAAIYFALIASAYVILKRRGVNLSTFARNNRWLMIFLVYSLISIVWSDFPLIASKRWIKILGHPLMALVVLTDPVPQEAVKRLLKRVAYVLVPLSICFIKYFPEYGRGFDSWTGEGFNGGVALNKNELGLLCLIFGMFLFWNTLQALKIKDRKARRKELILSIVFFALNWWLLSEASSATSLVTMLLGIVVMWFVGLRFVNKRYVGVYLIAAVVMFAVLEQFCGIYTDVVKGLGRNLTLTDRTEIWQAVLKLQDNPIFGRGFESFWLGSRLDILWAKFPFRPIQAHNGYIETYLDLGWIGVGILIGQFVGTFQKIQQDLVRRFEFARLRLAFLLAIIVFNYTEAAFINISIVWTMFFLIAVDYPPARTQFSKSIHHRTARKLVPAGGVPKTVPMAILPV